MRRGAQCAVSVLMCVYNGGIYLGRAVESVLLQTWTDFEFVIVDDGSTDGTPGLLEDFQARDPRIRVIRKRNTGLQDSLNVGLANLTGELVARLDADDWCVPERLAVQVRYLRDHSDVALVGSNAILVDEEDREVGRTVLGPIGHAELLGRLERQEGLFAHSSWMVRRAVMMELQGYDVFYRRSEDYDLLLRLCERYRLGFLPVPLIYLRKREGSISYEPGFEQFKGTIVALLMHYARIGRLDLGGRTREDMYRAAERFIEARRIDRLLMSTHALGFVHYSLKAGRVATGLGTFFRAFLRDPFCLWRPRRLRRVRATLPELVVPFLRPLSLQATGGTSAPLPT